MEVAESYLTGVDKRGGKGYQEVPCEICGETLFISQDAESGICARCVTLGFPQPTKIKVNPIELWKAIEGGRAGKFRREHQISQDQAANILGLTRKTYRETENGKIGRITKRKIERKLAQAERSHQLEGT